MLRTLTSLKNLKGKRVLLRVDYNVPVEKKRVTDATRILETLPTLQYLIKSKARVVLITHLGRPKGKVVPELRLDPIEKELTKLLKKKVKKLNECVGPKVEKAIAAMKDGEVILLENIRFEPEEEKGGASLTKKLAKLGDIFVNDAFATCHRDHVSVCGIARALPSYAGLLLAAEIENLSPLLKKPARPFVIVVGGAKIDTKIGIIKQFMGVADTILIGGALANTFLSAQGFDIADSLYEKDKVSVAQEILLLSDSTKTQIVLPLDAVVADEVSATAETAIVPVEDVVGSMKILDIGRLTIEKYLRILHSAKTVVWNGPMGLYEYKPFENGTKALALGLSLAGKRDTKTYLGGGDTLDALARLKMKRDKYTFVSTGGGAMLEFLEGKSLPGISVLI